MLRAACNGVPPLLDIGLVGRLEPVGQAHDAVLQLGTFEVADAVERCPFARGELADALDDRLDQIGLGGGIAFALRKLRDPRIGTNGEQLVLGGGLVSHRGGASSWFAGSGLPALGFLCPRI